MWDIDEGGLPTSDSAYLERTQQPTNWIPLSSIATLFQPADGHSSGLFAEWNLDSEVGCALHTLLASGGILRVVVEKNNRPSAGAIQNHLAVLL